MKFTVIDAPQRSPEWFAARAGRLTGSKADCVVAVGRGGSESVQRRDYRLQLACELLTGVPQEAGYTNADMQRGIDKEPLAIDCYEARTGEIVERTGFIQCDEYMVGCSLDGHLGNFDKILEIKAPKTATHMGYWRDPQSFVNQYAAQLAHNMTVTGATHADLVSFDDRLPASLQLLIVPVDVTNLPLLEGYWPQAQRFLAEVTVEFRSLKELADKQLAVAA